MNQDYLGQSMSVGDTLVVASKKGSGNAFLYTATITDLSPFTVRLASNGRLMKLHPYDLKERAVVIRDINADTTSGS